MKKQMLTPKLFLQKKTITPLNTDQQQNVAGGASENTCQVTMIKQLCNGNTNEYGCTTHSLGIACTVIFCV